MVSPMKAKVPKKIAPSFKGVIKKASQKNNKKKKESTSNQGALNLF